MWWTAREMPLCLFQEKEFKWQELQTTVFTGGKAVVIIDSHVSIWEASEVRATKVTYGQKQGK